VTEVSDAAEQTSRPLEKSPAVEAVPQGGIASDLFSSDQLRAAGKRLRLDEQEFQRQMAEAQQALNNRPAGELSLPGERAWSEEIQSLQRELTRLEAEIEIRPQN
jgi:hypothetical protein